MELRKIHNFPDYKISGAGKGDTYRPVNRKKWDTAWLRINGERCDVCAGRGNHENAVPHMKNKVRTTCLICGGLGYVEKLKQ